MISTELFQGASKLEVKQIKKTRAFSLWWFLLILLFILIIIPVSAFTLWIKWAFSPANSSGKDVVFVISENETVVQIAAKLKENNLIRDALAFRIYTRFACNGLVLTDVFSWFKEYPIEKCLAGNLQAGSFKLSPKMNLNEIATTLTKGRLDSWTKIVEGLRVEEMAAVFAKNYKVSEEDFLEIAKEGYMFPDTYLFKVNTSAVEIVEKMRSTFDLKVSSELKTKILSQGLSVEEGIILASILERESRNTAERPIVAGILYNRIRNGWKLETDATVQYALGYDAEGKTWWKKSLFDADLKVDSPYNTRKYLGLPPTPICSPGLSAIKAIAEPAETDYFFYLHDSSGKIHFAKTLEEHNQNKAKYL